MRTDAGLGAPPHGHWRFSTRAHPACLQSGMLDTLRFISLAVLCTALPALAQTSTAPADAPARLAPESRVQRIQHEDALSRIDELRVGGQTRSIDVQPKNGAPAYQIAPENTNGSPADNAGGTRTGSAGKSSWRLLSF